MAAAIFMLKDDFIKRQEEVNKIIEEQKKVREEILRQEQEKKEQDKKQEKDKDEDKNEEDNDGDEPKGSEAQLLKNKKYEKGLKIKNEK